ncbi:hypothetical protein L0664_06610 [Octadecabacter sp. G9-8]|uniref:Uncharacterized protein n=1 Tax=Octadecabacter dasysiphoniae TaxID=2909341 RepID=A0ABS9CU93_9RHOB|nr:hypothetical protein [Octadecabacter dasysiphoniae]MCF2870733.1 hypothetical protein [Octadecabacter dasysiphoniae]
MRLILPLITFCAGPVAAQDTPVPLPFLCEGADPAWSMTITEDGTLFETATKSDVDLDIAWETRTEGADWPRALTLIGRGSSAIVIVEPPQDTTFPVRILTQDGETPLLLVGSCTTG